MPLSTSSLPLTGGGFWVAFAQVALVYYGFAAAIHWVIPRFFKVESVQVGKRRPGQVKKEAMLSIGPIAVKALVFTCVEALSLKTNLTKLYSGPVEGIRGWGYLLLTVAALDLLHDAWFYWTHRWMHSWKPLYRRVHSLHHESTVPSAFTGYAFHPIEGAIVFLNEILVTFLFPIHVGLHRSYHLWTTVIHNGGHAGYEIAPFIPSLAAAATGCVELASAAMGKVAAISKARAGGKAEEKLRPSRRRAAALRAEATSKRARAALNTVRHHDMHHRFPFAHFSLYFTHWDRALGTEHAGYRAAVEAHFAPKELASAAAAAAEEEEVEEEEEDEKSGGVVVASSSASNDEKPSSASQRGLERLASAMEEYALLSQRKREQKKLQKQQQRGQGPARPRSPGISAWRPSADEAEMPQQQQQQQQRRSSRLARAA